MRTPASITIALVLVGGVACGRPYPTGAPGAGPRCTTAEASGPCGDPSPATGPPYGAMRARVVRTVDGDTVVLALGGRRWRVRLIGLDAPETWARRDCFGAEASRALRRIAPPGTVVRVAGDRDPYDRYGRRLLYLWTARGRLVAEQMVRDGYARAMAIPPNTRYAALLRGAEAAARHARAGLWAACV